MKEVRTERARRGLRSYIGEGRLATVADALAITGGSVGKVGEVATIARSEQREAAAIARAAEAEVDSALQEFAEGTCAQRLQALSETNPALFTAGGFITPWPDSNFNMLQTI